MTPDLEPLVRYVQETLGLRVTPMMWNDERLPHYIRQLYEFHEVELLGGTCLLMFDTGPDDRSPSIIKKHVLVVQRQVDTEVIYVRRQLTPYHRKRLVEQKVAFVVPGNQMYLPPLGIDFREHFRRPLPRPRAFSPATQVLLLYLVLRHRNERLTSTEAAKHLGYTRMTMIRALDELQAADLGEVSTIGKVGRERYACLTGEPRVLWTEAQPFLRSPVAMRLNFASPRPFSYGKRAGLTALADLTMLAHPARPAFALSRGGWRAIREKEEIVEVPIDDPETQELEIWHYEPALLSDGDLVDPLSLYLSLQGNPDERVEASLQDLLESFAW